NANTHPGADTIVLASGTYSPAGTVVLKDDVTIQGSNTSPGVKIDGAAVQPFPSDLIDVNANVTATLNRVTVSAGGALGTPSISTSGAIDLENTTVANSGGAGLAIQAGGSA